MIVPVMSWRELEVAEIEIREMMKRDGECKGASVPV